MHLHWLDQLMQYTALVGLSVSLLAGLYLEFFEQGCSADMVSLISGGAEMTLI